MLDEDGSTGTVRQCWRLAKPLCIASWIIHKITIALPGVSLTDSPIQGKDQIYKDTHCSIFITSEKLRISKS